MSPPSAHMNTQLFLFPFVLQYNIDYYNRSWSLFDLFYRSHLLTVIREREEKEILSCTYGDAHQAVNCDFRRETLVLTYFYGLILSR